MTKSVDDLLSTLPTAAFRRPPGGEGAFAPKLTLAERRGILALHYKGVNQRVLAAAFGINRRTLAAMVNPHSQRYKGLRKAMDDIGPKEFCDTYITEALTLKVNAALNSAESKLGQADYDDRPRSTVSQRANKYQGTHNYKDKNHAYTHVLSVFWDENSGTWAYCDTNGYDTSEYPGFNTSAEALKEAKAAAMDALEE